MIQGSTSLRIALAGGALVLAFSFALSSCATAPAPAPTPVVAPAPTPPPPVDLATLVANNDTEGIKKYFSNLADLDKPDANGSYPLHNAVMQGPELVSQLLSKTSNVDPLDARKRSPLRLAIEEGKTAAAKILADHKAALFSQDSSGSSLAEAAVTRGAEMVKAVFGNNVNARGPDGSTVLMIAADKLAEDSVYALLDAGADATLKTNAAGTGALDLALLHPDRIEAARIAEALIRKGAIPKSSDFNWFVLTVKDGNYSAIRFDDKQTPLHMAVERRQRGFVQFLLEKKASPNERDSSGAAPLHVALSEGWLDGAALLLANGANPNLRASNDNTPLHIALPEASRVAGIDLLLSSGANPSLQDKSGDMPLHIAIRLGYPEELVRRLIAAGSAIGPAVINTANKDGDTPIILAARAQRLEYMQALISAGADILLVNTRKESALSLAIVRVSPEAATASPAAPGQERTATLAALLVPSNVGRGDNLGNTPLAIAVGLKAAPEAIALIVAKGGDVNAVNSEGDAPLHLAVRQGLRVQGEALLSLKANVFLSNAKGETPITLGLTASGGPTDWLFNSAVIAARDGNGDTVLHVAAKANLSTTLAFLGDKGVEIDAKNQDGETALTVAIKKDAADSVKALVAMGASLATRDATGDTALHAALQWTAAASLAILLDAKADLSARNFAEKTALHYAVSKGDLAGMNALLARGAPLEARDSGGDTALAVAAKSGRVDIAGRLLASGADLETRNLDGKTPLLLAVEDNDRDMAKALVAANADILAADARGNSPVSIAESRLALLETLLAPPTVNRKDSNGRNALRLLVDGRASVQAIELALAKDSSIDARDNRAATALHAALRLGSLPVVTLLASAGADLYARDADGDTPASLAIARGPESLEALLAMPLASARPNPVPTATRLKSVDPLGKGLLYYAALNGAEAAVDRLLALGADRTIRNILGETAADAAKKRGFTSIAAKLK